MVLFCLRKNQFNIGFCNRKTVTNKFVMDFKNELRIY